MKTIMKWLSWMDSRLFVYLPQQDMQLTACLESEESHALPCTNWMWYCVSICWTQKEKYMGCLDLTARAHWCTGETGVCTHWDPRTTHVWPNTPQPALMWTKLRIGRSSSWRSLLCRGFHQHAISRGLSSRVVIFGVKHLFPQPDWW